MIYTNASQSGSQNKRPYEPRHGKGDPQNNENPGSRPLTENIDTGYGVLHGCGIRRGPVHREVNTEKQPLDFSSGGWICFTLLHMRSDGWFPTQAKGLQKYKAFLFDNKRLTAGAPDHAVRQDQLPCGYYVQLLWVLCCKQMQLPDKAAVSVKKADADR